MNLAPADRRELATALRRLADQAGQAILAVYATAFEARTKADRSPVTDADEAAEAVILAGLAALTPDLPVVAEESVARGRVPDTAAGRFWLVDPLDGTKEFINRNGEFTVNIALIEDRRPTLGVVGLPAIGLTYVAEAPGRVWRQADGAEPVAIAARQPPADGMDVLASRHHLDPADEAFLKTVPVRRLVSAGSSLKFCRIAEGTADLYPRLGPTNEWDTAAGHAVLAAAGGSVRTADGAELLYNKPGYRNPGFIARGAPG